jgi:cytidylate kinase
MRITVSGLPGSGTTSLSRYLSERHGFLMISAGEVFRQLAKEHNLGLAEFGRLAEENPEFDKMIDARQKEIAGERDNIIVEGRLSGWMVADADLRIWLFAPIDCRIKRIVSRDQIADEKTAERITLEREKCEAVRYRGYYDIDINDLSIYQIILNSEHWGVEGLGAIVDTAIMQLSPQETR